MNTKPITNLATKAVDNPWWAFKRARRIFRRTNRYVQVTSPVKVENMDQAEVKTAAFNFGKASEGLTRLFQSAKAFAGKGSAAWDRGTNAMGAWTKANPKTYLGSKMTAGAGAGAYIGNNMYHGQVKQIRDADQARQEQLQLLRQHMANQNQIQ
jgi:hypothetical protein